MERLEIIANALLSILGILIIVLGVVMIKENKHDKTSEDFKRSLLVVVIGLLLMLISLT